MLTLAITDNYCVSLGLDKLESANQQRCAVEAQNHDLTVKHQEKCEAHLKLQEQLSTEQAARAELRQSLDDAEARHAAERATLLAEKEQLSASLTDSKAAIADLARKQVSQAEDLIRSHMNELSVLRTQLLAARDEVTAAKTQNDDLAAQLTSVNQQHEVAIHWQQAQVPPGLPKFWTD
jgi:chromosome segregation ATPase